MTLPHDQAKLNAEWDTLGRIVADLRSRHRDGTLHHWIARHATMFAAHEDAFLKAFLVWDRVKLQELIAQFSNEADNVFEAAFSLLMAYEGGDIRSTEDEALAASVLFLTILHLTQKPSYAEYLLAATCAVAAWHVITLPPDKREASLEACLYSVRKHCDALGLGIADGSLGKANDLGGLDDLLLAICTRDTSDPYGTSDDEIYTARIQRLFQAAQDYSYEHAATWLVAKVWILTHDPHRCYARVAITARTRKNTTSTSTGSTTPKQLSTFRVSLIVLSCGLLFHYLFGWIISPYVVYKQHQAHNTKAASQVMADVRSFIIATRTLPRGVQQIDDKGYSRRSVLPIDADGSTMYYQFTERQIEIWSSGNDKIQRTDDDLLMLSEPHAFGFPIPISPQRQPETQVPGTTPGR